ncbi:MAG: polysaccharide biosynthesis tyrosine autokinase [Candidatus Aminicenantes bacterium]|nr:polysaccharide biosynthesis tyrosine autokinase [Candidatus Aminicenantes bacterium]
MYHPEDEETEINLLEYWHLLLKRKWVVIACVGAAVFFKGVYVFKVTPQYKAVSTMMIEEESSRVLSIEDEFGYRQSVVDPRFFNTQIKLLSSKALMERVARKLDLVHHPLFEEEGNNKKNSKEKTQIDPYTELAEGLKESLEVSPVRDTKLVEVGFKSPDPEFAAQLVNTVSEEFVDFYIEKRFQTTQRASRFLEEQISDLRQRLAVKETDLQEYSREKDLYFLSERESAAVSEFADINQAYTQARIDRINAQAKYEELKNVSLDSLPQFSENQVLRDLKTEYVQIKNEYEEMSQVFKSDYPDLVKIKGRLDSMRTELESEITSAREAAETEYKTALNKENSLQQLLEEQKADVAQMNSDAIQYNNLLIEVQNMRDQLASLEQRQSETLVSSRLGDLKTTNVSVIDAADIPLHPVSPKKKVSLILALMVGLFGGVGLAFVLEYLDNSIRSPEEAEKMTGVPSLGVVPYLPPNGLKKIKRSGYSYRYAYRDKGGDKKTDKFADIKKIELVNHLHPNFTISEDYRTIRTSILLSSAGSPPSSMAFTSAQPKDGKSVTVANMAVSFAQLNERILVVDADMRKPQQHRIFKLRAPTGLSSYLTGKTTLEDSIHATKIEGISLLPCGPVPPNPTELLNSKPMKQMISELKDKYDKVIYDLPPVLAVVDPVVLANLVEATVVVVYPRQTTEKAFVSAVEELRRGRTKIIGTVFNGMRLDKDDYYYKSFYKSYYRSREKTANGEL